LFKDNLKRTIGKVLKENGYKERILHKDCVYYLKRFSDKLAFYIRCSDSRDNNAGAMVEMFFTAIQYPDDRILSLEAGIHIHILTVWEELADEVLIAAGEKIVAIEQGIGNASDTIVKELESPYFLNQRMKVYNTILQVYNTLNEDIELQDEFNLLKKQVSGVAKKKSLKEAYAFCDEFVDKLPNAYFEKKGIKQDLEGIKDMLAEQISAQCLLG